MPARASLQETIRRLRLTPGVGSQAAVFAISSVALLFALRVVVPRIKTTASHPGARPM